MTLILDGKIARDLYANRLKEKISHSGKLLSLAIVQIGSRPESNSYIEAKIKFGQQMGVAVEHIKFHEDVKEVDVISKIEELNEDDHTDGIILQLPVPEHLSKQTIIDAISPKKDVDGLTSVNAKKRIRGEPAIMPATARGVIELLDFYKIEIEGKKAAVLGRSQLAGGPIADALKRRGAKVTICHSGTYNEEEITKKSDIVIVAIGKPKFVDANFFLEGKNQTVVDVGINRRDGKFLEEIGKKLIGDVDFKAVEPLVGAISPVPGGVGQMTVLGLFENLVDCACELSA
jgi:methylenetetrahydrofolate dehydrogenase (NADP+) / methenyltetrahydrofolate cyclohydrolase